MRTFVIILFYFLFIQCSSDRTINNASEKEIVILEKFKQLDSVNKLVIPKANEPGEKLLLCITFVEKESKKPISNQQVHFYHTSAAGEYEPFDPNDETTARLHGSAQTNMKGNIYIETILPGDYGSGENNRHIHTTVFGARPEFYDIFFEQYSGGIGTFMNSGNDQMFYADLKKLTDNTLVGFVTIEVKNFQQ